MEASWRVALGEGPRFGAHANDLRPDRNMVSTGMPIARKGRFLLGQVPSGPLAPEALDAFVIQVPALLVGAGS
jgi:hypothetical protein